MSAEKISHQFENWFEMTNHDRSRPRLSLLVRPQTGAAIRFFPSRMSDFPCRGGYHPPAAGPLPGRRRCEASRRGFRRRRRCETKRSDLGWRFSFFSHSFFCKKKKEWEKEKTCPLRWISSFTRGRGRCAGPSIFLVLGKKDTGEKEPLFACLKGFFAPSPRITARIRSLWRSVGGHRALLTKPSV